MRLYISDINKDLVLNAFNKVKKFNTDTYLKKNDKSGFFLSYNYREILNLEVVACCYVDKHEKTWIPN